MISSFLFSCGEKNSRRASGSGARRRAVNKKAAALSTCPGPTGHRAEEDAGAGTAVACPATPRRSNQSTATGDPGKSKETKFFFSINSQSNCLLPSIAHFRNCNFFILIFQLERRRLFQDVWRRCPAINSQLRQSSTNQRRNILPGKARSLPVSSVTLKWPFRFFVCHPNKLLRYPSLVFVESQ